MTPDLRYPGAVLISTCIILGGVLIGAETFSITIPFAPYIMVILAACVVLGAAALVLSCQNGSEDRLQR